MNWKNNSTHGRLGASFLGRCACLFAVLACTMAAGNEEVPHAKTTAPPDHVLLDFTRGGAFYVTKTLKEEYDRLLARVQTLQADLDAERITGADAMLELRALQEQLKTLRADIDKKKVLLAPTKVHRQSETTTFELGPEKLLVITADSIRVQGWEGPGVKCVLDKSVVVPEGKPADDHLRGIKVVHRHGRAPDLVGRTPAETQAEAKASENGSTKPEPAGPPGVPRKPFITSMADRFEMFRAFQGKDIDTLEIEGLTHQQGNRSIVVEIDSSDSHTHSSKSEWQRQAALTVYVPTCEAVALRGCLVSLDVQGLQAALILTDEDSQDCDYAGRFQVRDLHGSLTVENAPLDLLETIHGDVSIRSTVELANSGTRHDGNGQTVYMTPPRALTCRNLDGSFSAWFTRSNLKLEAIKGRVDVRNEFGDTTWAIGSSPAEKAHRVLSESGRIEVSLARKALKRLPLIALTNCGTVRTDMGQDVLEDVMFTVGRDLAGTSRSWHGLIPKAKDGGLPGSVMILSTGRLDAALQGSDRAAGVDLISRCGTVSVLSRR